MNISIIIPLFNAEKYISKALDSCLQFSEVKEVIVIDDAYPDGAADIVKSYASQDARVILLHHPEHNNMGAGASRNLGIRAAGQDYIAFLDADDFYLPDRFSKDRQTFAEHPDADGCYSALGCHFYSERAKSIFFDRFGNEMTTVAQDHNPTPENLFEGLSTLIKGYGYFSLDTLTLKRDALLKSRLLFNETLRIHQDTDFLIKLAYYCRLYPSNIQKPVSMRGVHDENRITAVSELDIPEKSHRQYLLWNSLYEWALNEGIGNAAVLKQFRDKRELSRMFSNPHPTPWGLIKEIFVNKAILKNNDYSRIHRHYTKSMGNMLSWGSLKVKNFLYRH